MTFITHEQGVVDCWGARFTMKRYLLQIGFSCDFLELNFRRKDAPFGLLFNFGENGSYDQDGSPGNVDEVGLLQGRAIIDRAGYNFIGLTPGNTYSFN